MQKKKGISLIVLVITIIVMIILAAAIILSLNNAGIIGNANKAVAETNLAQMKELASMSWGTAYAEGARTLEQLETKIQPELKDAVGKELDNYEVTVGLKGVTVVTKTVVPADWQDNVTTILDGVPIPKGFVASKALGENTKDEGFVIYEKTEELEEVNDENVEWAKRNIDQYVWISVDDFSNFKRDKFGGSAIIINTMPGTGKEVWEVIIDEETNMPVVGQSEAYSSYITPETEAEVIAMYNSVKKYGGFYIARYEMGIAGNTVAGGATSTNKATIYSQMNKVPNAHLDGIEAMTISRKIYANSNENVTGVVSTLVYGVQWDAMLKWMRNRGLDVDSLSGNRNDAKAIITEDDVTDGSKYLVVNGPTNEYTEFKNVTKENETWLLTTGALKAAKIFNIWDIAGNVSEVTMEKHETSSVYRGSHAGEYNARFSTRSAIAGKYANTGARVSLYIK